MKTIVVCIKGGNALPEEIEDGIKLVIQDLDIFVQETYIAENNKLYVFSQKIDENGNEIGESYNIRLEPNGS